MNTDQPFHLWSLDRLLSPEPIESTERPDISGAPLDLEERAMLAEARRFVAEREESNWRTWLGLD